MNVVGLKIRRPSGLGGSTPPPGTKPKSPQNEWLDAASSPHEAHSAADAADFAPYIVTSAKSITLKSIGLWTDAVVGGAYTSVTHFQICTTFQGDEDGGTTHQSWRQGSLLQASKQQPAVLRLFRRQKSAT